MLILFILFLIPFIVYILNVKHYKIQNLFYFIKFLIFNLIVLCYSTIYLCYYVIFFVFKNYRFFGYYYQNTQVSKFYYKKKSIYFLFWKYLTIYVIANIYNIIIFILYNIIIFIKKYFYINNIFLIIWINSQILLFSDNIRNIIKLLYNFIIILCYHFFNFININWIYLFTKRLNIFNRWDNIQDPLLKRNIYIKFIDFLNVWIFKRVEKVPFKAQILKILLKKYILNYIFLIIHNWDVKKVHVFLLNIWIMQKVGLSKSAELINFAILGLYYFNIIFINMVYILIMFILNFIHIIFYSLWKYKNYLIYIFIIFFCIKYYWCINYFFLILYKHYMLYLPISEVKESFRFFNFEWIDMRNYYDLVLLRNTLVDTSVFNNSIYNDLLNNLSQTLHYYGFKITPKYNVAMYSTLKDIYNKDTDLLNNMFKNFNENKSYSKYKWYIRMRKIFNNKLKSVYHYYKPKKGLTRREKRLNEYLYNRINLNTQNKNIQDTRHFIEHKFPMTQEVKKKIGIYNYYTKGYYRKKISKKFAMLNLGHFLKLKKIPLRYTSIHSPDNITNKRLIPLFKWLINDYKAKYVKSFYKRLKFGVNSFRKLISFNDYKFYLGQFYSFPEYGTNTKYMVYKHKIPTFNWTIARWKRRIPNKLNLDFLYTATIDTEHPFMTYRDVPKKKVLLKRNFKIRFINSQYPYSINQYYNIERTMNYFSVLNNLKIIKKYYYIYNTKLYLNKKYYGMALESNRVFIKQFLYRLSLIKKPFNKYHFFKSKSKSNVNFWFFFDYMKTNKYFHQKYKNIYGDQHYVNFYFIKRTRKNYIKLRNDLIRMYSLYFYYRNFERTNFKNWWPETLSTFEHNVRNQDRFDSLRVAWFTYSYLTNDRTNVKLLKNIRILNQLFRENFLAYHIYCENINYHNIGYHEQIDAYKLKVLNKINNLKRFFYFQNKRNSGWSIFKYLNVFSIKYHIKHLLWHNPYSFLIYKNKFSFKFDLINLNYIFSYSLDNKIIKCNKYSLIFNLYLNTFEINENIWSFHQLFIDSELKNYYNFGISNYYNSSDFEVYRLIMNFIFYYYKNFLYRLIRYRYILDHKNYTLLKFFKRYFNIMDWFYHSYFRFRLLIHKYIFFGNFIKKSYNKIFKFRYLYSFRVRRNAFLPFWFYFDDFTKIFMHVVLNKFYITSNFLFYWFYVNYNFNLLYICIFFYNFKFYLINKILMLNNWLINLQAFKIESQTFKMELSYIFNNYLANIDIKDDQLQYVIVLFEVFINFLYKIYNNILNLIKFNYIMLLFYLEYIYMLFNKYISKMGLSNTFIYIKWYISIMLKAYNNIWLNIIYTHVKVILKIYYFNFNVKVVLKLNNIFYIKYYLSKLLLYYCKIIFNMKSTLVYLKPNYYNFRQQKNLRFIKKFRVYFKSNFVSTRTVRNIYSFKHYTDNMVFLKNISFFNMYNYLYLMNNYDLNLLNVSINLFIIFKNQSIIYIIFIYLFIYFFVFFLLFIIYRKFYNIYFFCRSINNDLQDNWEKMFNNKTSILLKNTSKIKYFNHLWKSKKRQSFYNFFSFNLFISKKNTIQQLLFKIFMKDKLYNKIKENFNNNYIINIKNTKFLLDFSTVLYKLYDYIKQVNIKHWKVTKEKKIFNFYFYNFINSNTFNFCFLYWFIIIPFFFFEYIWMRYHLKGHIRIKRQYFLFLKVFLNNFKFYVQLSKLIGLNNYYTSHKKKLPRNYQNGTRYRRKRKLKLGYFFKWDRFSNTLVRLSSLGNYFYWFSHINKWEYFLSYRKYFFNFSYQSNYFYLIYIYILFFIGWNYKKCNRCRI